MAGFSDTPRSDSVITSCELRLTIDGALDTTVEVPADGRLSLVGAGTAAATGSSATGSSSSVSPTAGGGSAAVPSVGAEPGVEGSPAAGGGSPAASQVVLIEALPVPPGGAVDIGISSPAGGTVTRSAPVVLDQGPYTNFVPVGAPAAQ